MLILTQECQLGGIGSVLILIYLPLTFYIKEAR
jgi:hypothetical protein